MAIRIYKPTTNARRGTSVADFSDLTKKEPEKRLTIRKKMWAGRNNTGKITVRHQGSGEKRRIRLVDFKRLRFGEPATVIALEYDPNRSARLALIQYEKGDLSYILAQDKIKIGDKVMSSDQLIPIKDGNRLPLKFIPAGINVCEIELNKYQGAVLARSAGAYAVLQAVEGQYAQLKVPSGEIRLVSKECLATIGAISNLDHNLIRIGKAGRMRHMGVRPTVRGKVMNPVDHPHGGGEGRQPIGMPYPKTPWGKHALGVKTRKRKKWSSKLILERRKKNK